MFQGLFIRPFLIQAIQNESNIFTARQEVANYMISFFQQFPLIQSIYQNF